MTDPTRWSEGGDASELVRDLVVAGQEHRLPAAEKRALWASIEAALPAPRPAIRRPRFAGKWAKAALLVAALGGIALAAQQAARRAEPRRAPALSASAPVGSWTPAAPPSAPIGAAPSPSEPPSEVEPSSEPRPPLPSEPRRPSGNQLLEESRAVLGARAALRAGDAARALTLLERARSQFPRGRLDQEREALTIEALARSGQSAKARLRAEKFLQAYPQSPYAADVRRASGL